jgi:predicted HicB family RNase H-like nuclease
VAASNRRGYKQLMQRRKKLEPISIRLDPEVKRALEAQAVTEDRSLSAYINRVLRFHVDSLPRPSPTEKKPERRR